MYKTPKKLNKELKEQVSYPVVALQNGTGTTMMPKELLPETKEKKSISHKPDSVIPVIKPERLSFIWPLHYYKDRSCLPSPIAEAFAGPAKDRGLCGISAHKVYPLFWLPKTIVSSYLTFSPLFALWTKSYFLWHCLLPGVQAAGR